MPSQCLTVMIESFKKALDNRLLAGAILTDLSKAFDCLKHDLLIAKLNAYGFDNSSLKYILSYLSKRKHRTKVNNSYSSWSEIKTGVPQGSILGPLLFNIYLNDIFFFVDKSNITNYADDNTPYATESNIDELLITLKNDTDTLLKWFDDNYFKANDDKCHLLVTNHSDETTLLVGKELIKGPKSVKLLGITIDNKLNFNGHVSNICDKVSQKLHILARVAVFINTDKLRILMKAFIESEFNYCPLVWMFHSRTLNNRINRLHEKALRLVYKDDHCSFEELLNKDNAVSIHHRNLQILVTEMYKVKNNLSSTIMSNIFQEDNTAYDLRNKREFKTGNVRTVLSGTETISYR